MPRNVLSADRGGTLSLAVRKVKLFSIMRRIIATSSDTYIPPKQWNPTQLSEHVLCTQQLTRAIRIPQTQPIRLQKRTPKTVTLKDLKVKLWGDDEVEVYPNRQEELDEFLLNGGHVIIGVMSFIRSVHEVFMQHPTLMTIDGWAQPTIVKTAVLLHAERRRQILSSHIEIIGAGELRSRLLG